MKTNKIMNIIFVLFLLCFTMVSAEKIDAKVDNIYYPHHDQIEEICESPDFDITRSRNSIVTYTIICNEKKHHFMMIEYYSTYAITVGEYGDIKTVVDTTFDTLYYFIQTALLLVVLMIVVESITR